MGKQTTITCDKCGKNLAGASYTVLSISTVKDGKRSRLPSVWLCIRCWMQTGLAGCHSEQTFCPECHMPMGSDEKKCSECDVSWTSEGEESVCY